MKSSPPAARQKAAAPAAAVKICGLTDAPALHAAIACGAAYLGLVFVKDSKRAITAGAALSLLETLPQPTLCRFMPADRARHEDGHLVLVALLQDPTDAQVKDVLRLRPLLGLIQLHGKETPERVAAIRALSGLPVMKAIAIESADDLAGASAYERVADMLLFDAKVGGRSGGTGKTFDWSLLKGRKFKRPWMLAGGLSEDNVAEALRETGAVIVDVSSGVETRGRKDPAAIARFVGKVRE